VDNLEYYLVTDVNSQIYDKVREIVSTVFKLPPGNVTVSTSINNVKAWDSVGHLNLVLAIQEEFSIGVPPEDFEKLTSIEAITEYLIPVSSTAPKK
jgi:acyl carrier protein